jgi:hypothetical protein
VSQQLIPTGDRSGLQTHIATTEKRFVVHGDEKVTAFMELEGYLGLDAAKKLLDSGGSIVSVELAQCPYGETKHSQ